MLNSLSFLETIEDSPSAVTVSCDDISQIIGTNHKIINVADLPDMVILYVDPEGTDRNGLSLDSLRDILRRSEWSWLVRDIFISDHTGLHEAVEAAACNHKIKVTYDRTDVSDVTIKKGGRI